MESQIASFLKLVDRQSKWTLRWICLLLLGLLGLLDYLSGFELSFSLFYLAPVSLAAWGLTRIAGLQAALMSATIWLISNHLAGEQFSHPIIPWWNTFTRLITFSLVAIMVAEIRRLLNQEKRLSRTDSLTGGLNRRAFYEAIGAEISRVNRFPRPFAILYLDLDHFKDVNDHWGHEVGDQVLQTVMNILIQHSRGGDIAARLGGDEFALLIPEISQWRTHVLTDRIQSSLLDAMSDRDWPVTFSIGVIWCETVQSSLEELIQEADKMMYQAKQDGRNTVRYATC